MKKPIIIVSVISIVTFIISKLLWWTNLVSLFLALSIPGILYLSQIKDKKRILATIWWLIILSIDLLLIILLIVPTKSYQINVEDYYKNKETYAKIFFKDDPKQAKNLIVIIKNNWDIRKTIKVEKYIKTKKKEKILLKQWDKIYFACKKKKYCKTYKSFLVVYLWDDSILRMTPWSIIDLKKITKNLNNLSESKTKISVEKWNLRFRVIRLIKDSNSMQIETWKWQTLIIRWTAWLVSKTTEETYAVDYSHFIEVRNQDKSVLLKQWEWAKITDEDIDITNMDEILENIWLDENFLKELDNLDEKYLEESLKGLNNYLKSLQTEWILWKLEEFKLKTFSIWDKNYEEYLNNFTNYQYLIWNGKEFTQWLVNNPNLAFLASNLEKTEVKIWYLYNEFQKNIKNSDIYKTYIINMWIEWKVKDVRKKLEQYLDNPDIENIIDNADKNVNNLLDDFNF